MAEAPQPPYDFPVTGDRRAPQPFVYTPDELLGRVPIRLRRARDKRRLAAHLLAVVALVSLTAWWVLLPHGFAGPVVVVLTADHGVHVGDLPSLVFLAVAARSVLMVGRIARAMPVVVGAAEAG